MSLNPLSRACTYQLIARRIRPLHVTYRHAAPHFQRSAATKILITGFGSTADTIKPRTMRIARDVSSAGVADIPVSSLNEDVNTTMQALPAMWL